MNFLYSLANHNITQFMDKNHYTPDLYKKLYDDWNDPVNLRNLQDEIEIINKVKNSKDKTFVDLGAGYGRILPIITTLAKNVICLEKNPQMFKQLQINSKKSSNVTTILDDMLNLQKILTSQKINQPVFLLLQSTLSSVGDSYRKILKTIKTLMKKHQGEVIISLFRQQALKDWGIKMYKNGKKMNGLPDYDKTDFNKGLFVSQTGYVSKWWTDREILSIKKSLQGNLINQIKSDTQIVFHIK